MADNKAIQTKTPRFYAGFSEQGFPQFLYEADPTRPEIISLDKTWSLDDFRALLTPEQLTAFDTVYKNYVGDGDLVAAFAEQIDNVNVAKSPLGATLLAMEVATLGAKAKSGASLKEFGEALAAKLAELDNAVDAHNAKIAAEAKEPEAPATPAVETPVKETPVKETASKAEVVVVKNELSSDTATRLENFIKTGEAAVETGNLIFDAMDKLNQAARSNSKVVGNLTTVAKELTKELTPES